MMVSLVRWRTERNMLQVAHMTTDVHVSRGHYKVMDTLVLRLSKLLNSATRQWCWKLNSKFFSLF